MINLLKHSASVASQVNAPRSLQAPFIQALTAEAVEGADFVSWAFQSKPSLDLTTKQQLAGCWQSIS